MEFGAVERDQNASIGAAHGVQAAALFKFGHDVGEHRVEHRRFDHIEFGPDLAVAGDLANAEQGFAVRPALGGFEMPLMCQEGRALHEEGGERRKCEVGHGVACVPAPPLVRRSPAAPAQGIEKAVLHRHRSVESWNTRDAKPKVMLGRQFVRRCCVRDSIRRSQIVRSAGTAGQGSHSPWSDHNENCCVFILKCRRKTPYMQLRQYLGEVFRKLAEQEEGRIEEGHLMADHAHMMISIPPKYAVSQVVGFIKGKSAIHLARTFGEHRRNFVGQSSWARGYFVSTVCRDERVIRNYIRNHEQEDQRLEQMNLWR
jgi:putative transposase